MKPPIPSSARPEDGRAAPPPADEAAHPPEGGGPPDDLAIAVDPALLDAAVAAVEGRLEGDAPGDAPTAPPTEASLPDEPGEAPVPDEELLRISDELGITVEVPAPDGQSGEAEAVRGAALRPAADPLARALAAADALDEVRAVLDELRAALDRREAELGELRDENARLAAELRESRRERRRAAFEARNARDALARAEARERFALEARRVAEEQLERTRAALARREQEIRGWQERRNREQDDLRRHGHAPVVAELLPVLDHLEMAVAHADADADPSRVIEGVRMVVRQFHGALEAVGVRRVDARPGTPFRPEVHEAFMEVHTTDQPPGTIVAEISPGYRLGDRLVRAARVSVARWPEDAPVPEAPGEAAPGEAAAGEE